MRKEILFSLARSFRLKILLIVFSGLCASSSFSQPNTWLGGPNPQDTLASNPAFWSAGLPTATSEIIIPDGADPLFFDINTTCSTITFLSGSQLSRMTVAPSTTVIVTGNITIQDATAPRGIILFGSLSSAAIAGGTNPTPPGGNFIIMFTNAQLAVPGDVTNCNLVMFGDPSATFGGNLTGGVFVPDPLSSASCFVDFNSTDPQTVAAGTYGRIFFSGGGTKTLAGPITVIEEVAFSNGIVINSSSSIIFLDGSLGGVPGINISSPLSYATGPIRLLRQTVVGPVIFPVGKQGAGYHPVTIDPLLISPVDFTVEYIHSSGAALGPVTAPGILGVSNCEYWNIVRADLGGPVDVTLTWGPGSECNGPYITDPASVRVVHFNGTNWNLAGSTGGTGTAAAGNVSWFSASEFSPFTIGTTSPLNPLPVTLTDFSASRCGNNICLYWNTASENNNDHFEIERSGDGRQFNSIGSVNGNGTTSIPKSYTFRDDHPLNGKNYYRLKQVDIDRKFSYSSILRVNNSSVSSFNASISPNPASSVMNLIIEGVREKENLLFVVMNTSGMIVHRENISAGGTVMIKTMPRPAISAGLYFYKITRSSNNETFSGRVVLQ